MSGARYAPGRPFPAYAYLPGRDPHPTGDPRGHSFTSAPETRAAYLPPARWLENVDYLYGVDLYNAGYLWEAHEVWEGLWHQAKRDALQAPFLQGLIQCAAAALKVPMRQPNGLARLAEQGTARLERVGRETQGRFMGLDVASFVSAFRVFAASRPESADERPRIELA
jgi:hypothetical protein